MKVKTLLVPLDEVVDREGTRPRWGESQGGKEALE